MLDEFCEGMKRLIDDHGSNLLDIGK